MNAEVIVVGAGIVGSACAHELARRGLDVLVLDSRRGGATAVGMGHLVAMDDNPAELALSDYSIQAWRTWAADLPEDCAYRNCGTLWLAADASELAEAERKRQALQAAGVACRMLGAARLYALEPALRPGLAGALEVSGDGILYAPNAARWLLDQAGPRLRRLHAEVSEVDGSRLRLADGRWLSAEALVLANGIHAGELCAELPIRPKKGHLLITDRYPGTLRHQLVELGYVSSAHASSGTSVAFNAQPRPPGRSSSAPRGSSTRSTRRWKARCWRACCGVPWTTCRGSPASMRSVPGPASAPPLRTACRCSASTRRSRACGWRSATRAWV